jgi:beta-adrenergic-receptor kinase
MADLESLLVDVSYILAMEKSKDHPAARASRKIQLPDASVHNVMHQYLNERGEVTFQCIFSQKIGCFYVIEFGKEIQHIPLMFYNEIVRFEKTSELQERLSRAKRIFDMYIMPDLLTREQMYSPEAESGVKCLLQKQEAPESLFNAYKAEILTTLHSNYKLFDQFLLSEQYVRFCQWKNLELNQVVGMHDFTVHRLIGRGGFGEVYGCRKIDTGMMYAMKCLDKKRLKLRKGEAGPINERNMLAMVNNPFVVCMTYAFQTTDRICLVLDLMNGGDLNYQLTIYKSFSEPWVRFYAQEIILGLEHLHNLEIVYRDLKPANCLLSEQGHVRISDLGLACNVSTSKASDRVGTHGYMAPEILQKDTLYDCCSDWFSFGCMLYKLLTG